MSRHCAVIGVCVVRGSEVRRTLSCPGYLCVCERVCICERKRVCVCVCVWGGSWGRSVQSVVIETLCRPSWRGSTSLGRL